MRSLLTMPVPQVRHAAPLLRPPSPAPQRTGIRLKLQARVNGMAVLAPRGWGKSRFLGRRVCYTDAINHIGTVCIDVVGGTINNALDKLLYLDEEDQLEVGSRLRYCNMSGQRVGETTYVTGWPQLYKYFPDEYLFATAQRPVELIRMSDRQLATSSIQGLNRLQPLLTSLGMVLTALDEPIYKAYDLLDEPDDWKPVLEDLAFDNPEARPAVLYLLKFFDLPKRRQEERTEVLRNKLFTLNLDPISKAMFGAKIPSIDWEEVAYKGLQVYLDFSGYEPKVTRELKFMWVWSSLMDYFTSRGARGHELPPLSVVLDETSYLVRSTDFHAEFISETFREMAEVRSRNSNILLTIATQDIKQLPEGMQEAFLSMGNILFGRVRDYHTAVELAKQWYRADPKKIKDEIWGQAPIPIWATISVQAKLRYMAQIMSDPMSGMEVKHRTFYPLEEQFYEHSHTFRDLAQGEWLFAQTFGEGEQATKLRKISTSGFDRGKYDSQNSKKIQTLKAYLMQRDGIAVPDMFSEIAKSKEEPPLLPETQAAPPVPVSGDGHYGDEWSHGAMQEVSENRHRQDVVPSSIDTMPAAEFSTEEEESQENGHKDEAVTLPEPPIPITEEQQTYRRSGELPLD